MRSLSRARLDRPLRRRKGQPSSIERRSAGRPSGANSTPRYLAPQARQGTRHGRASQKQARKELSGAPDAKAQHRRTRRPRRPRYVTGRRRRTQASGRAALGRAASSSVDRIMRARRDASLSDTTGRRCVSHRNSTEFTRQPRGVRTPMRLPRGDQGPSGRRVAARTSFAAPPRREAPEAGPTAGAHEVRRARPRRDHRLARARGARGSSVSSSSSSSSSSSDASSSATRGAPSSEPTPALDGSPRAAMRRK